MNKIKGSEKQKKTSLMGQDILRSVRSLILDRDMELEGRVNELKLANRLGVSRTPVRSALQQLAGEGLVKYEENRGFYIRAYDLADIQTAFEMRALAEGLAARLAAERGLGPEDEAKIEKSLADAAQGLDQNEADARDIYSQSNKVFHSAIQTASQSQLVQEVISLCHSVPQTLTQNVMSFSISQAQSRLQEHQDIYEAILFRKPRDAEEKMVRHVLGVRRAISRDYFSQQS